MKLTIESTPQFDTLDGMPVRVWRGTTQSGVPIELLVAGLRAPVELAGTGPGASEMAEFVARPAPAVVGVVVEIAVAPEFDDQVAAHFATPRPYVDSHGSAWLPTNYPTGGLPDVGRHVGEPYLWRCQAEQPDCEEQAANTEPA